MRLLITGASGLLGSKLAELAVSLGYEVYSCYLTHKPKHGIAVKADVQDKTSLAKAFEEAKPEAVVHTAALTDVDKCELDKSLAYSVNVLGTRNVAELSREYGSFLVYISTDYVFKGDRGMYSESDSPEPINYYGLTKLEGEKIVSHILGEYCIARSSVIYGSEPASGKANFALWILERLRRSEQVSVAIDQWNSPTLNSNLAEMIIETVDRRLTGIYHMAGASRVSRYEFAKALAETFKLNSKLIKQTTMNSLKWTAKRPKDSSLNVSKALKTLRRKPLELTEALEILKEELTFLKSS